VSWLERFWPGPIGLFQKLDSLISLAFLERYPSPADARGLGEQRLGAFLARQRYSGHKQPTELLTKLRRAPEGRVGDVELAARRALVLALVAAIKPLIEQIRGLDRQIATALHEHPDGEIFLSLFRDPRSVVTAAELLAEIGDCRARYPTRDTLAAGAGQAAVAIESGKRKTASFRWGCNKRLRGAFCTLSDSARHWHPWAADRYAAARARGHDHPRALRTLGRAWTRIVWRCWQDRTPYDPELHRGFHSTSRSRSPPRRAPGPTSLPPGGWPAPPSPTGRPNGPSAKRLTTSRHPLSRWGVDTGRLLCSGTSIASATPSSPATRGREGARLVGRLARASRRACGRGADLTVGSPTTVRTVPAPAPHQEVPLTMTDFPLTGGCNCGAVRFEVTAPLALASYCHCKRCQRRSGAAASANAHPAIHLLQR
jgi:hypothetical protein